MYEYVVISQNSIKRIYQHANTFFNQLIESTVVDADYTQRLQYMGSVEYVFVWRVPPGVSAATRVGISWCLREMPISNYESDPCYIYSFLAIAWNAILKLTGVE